METMTEAGSFAKEDVVVAIAALRAAVKKKLASTASFEQREAAWLAASNEATRAGLEAELQCVSDGLGEEVLLEGERYRQHVEGTVDYHSLCGALSVQRFTYRRVGERNGATIVPMELATGIAERATPALAFDVMQGVAKQDLRSHREDLVAAHRLPPSRSTLERMAQHLGDAARAHAPRIEAYVRRDEAIPDGAHAISAGLDRVAVPMEEPRPVDAPAPNRKKRKKAYVRKAPTPVDVNYRMAYVGTVSIVDVHGEVLTTRKYAIPASDDPKQIADKMAADVKTLLRRQPGLAVGIVQDGAPEMWNLVREAFKKHSEIGRVEEAIDRYHLMERLGKALALIERDPAARHARLREWSDDFEHHDSAIDRIEHWLIKRHSQLSLEPAAALWEHLTYLRRNKKRMRYVTIRSAGLPVGSGPTEGACKSVVGKRARGGGQRWHDSGLRNVLSLRALHQSNRLRHFWSHLGRRYRANVAVT